MNLIMSDVEETIMLVDPEGATNGRGVINVRRLAIPSYISQFAD
jgi:U6 snRNA-associated Sm-like protein LSm3